MHHLLLNAKHPSRLSLHPSNVKTRQSPCLLMFTDKWGNNGNSERLVWGGSKITTDGDCSHEIKRRLLLGRKV